MVFQYLVGPFDNTLTKCSKTKGEHCPVAFSSILRAMVHELTRGNRIRYTLKI